jgi:hypothetical protein
VVAENSDGPISGSNRKRWITDGASVPRNLWYVSGFAPFDFTRAAVIHDWLYEAHHRYNMAVDALAAARKRHDVDAINRNQADFEMYKSYAKLTQDDAADIFVECIKISMVQSRDIWKPLTDFRLKSRTPEEEAAEPFKELKASLASQSGESKETLDVSLFRKPGFNR